MSFRVFNSEAGAGSARCFAHSDQLGGFLLFTHRWHSRSPGVILVFRMTDWRRGPRPEALIPVVTAKKIGADAYFDGGGISAVNC